MAQFIKMPDGEHIPLDLCNKYKSITFFPKEDFLSFEEARKFIISLKLKGREEWQEYCKSGNKPDNIPASLNTVYKNKWKGMGDFLGTGNIANHNKIFLSFKEAREFARKLKLKNRRKWAKYCKSDKRPNNIPSRPDIIYKKEWIDWHDFLGTAYLSFEEAKKFVRNLRLKNYKEWREYCKSGNKPNNISSVPNKTYKDKGWINWGDFLGTGTIANYNRIFLSFKKAREFARKLKLKSMKEWKEYCKSGNKPNNIPSHPDKVYKDEWINFGDFLGTGNVHNKYKVFLSFKEAKNFVRKLKLRNTREWLEYCKSGKKPNNIPSVPNKIYKKEWISLGDFLGTGIVSSLKKTFLSFREARIFVRKLKLKNSRSWKEYCKSGNKPNNIPSNPNTFYKNKWIDWYNFLGTK